MSRRWAVILAGGDGVRLRPMTRGITGDERPKQFCALVTEDTLLTETRRRIAQTVPAPDLYRSFAEVASTLGTVGEATALERLYCGLPSVEFSRHVLGVRPDRFAVLAVRRVHWDDLGEPERVPATWRRARSVPMRPTDPVAIPA